MFDLATRLQSTAASNAMLAAVPFDLRLVRPTGLRAYPHTAFATSSAVPMPGVDMLATHALELESTLATAVILSLWVDARAGADDVLPPGQTDRRGWLGSEFLPAPVGGTSGGAQQGDSWGSLLWLLRTGKVLPVVLEQARFYAAEALDWLVRDGIASRVDVQAQWVGPREDRLAVRPTIWRPDVVRPVYDVLWGTSIQRWNQA